MLVMVGVRMVTAHVAQQLAVICCGGERLCVLLR